MTASQAAIGLKGEGVDNHVRLGWGDHPAFNHRESCGRGHDGARNELRLFEQTMDLACGALFAVS